VVARREKWGALVLLLPFFFFISAEVIAQTKDVKRISVLTGGTGGVFYPYGGAIATVISKHVPNVTATAEVTAAAIDNIKLLNAGKGELGILSGDAADDGLKGTGRFAKDGKIPLRALAVLYGNLHHVVVFKSSGINSIPELKGKRVSVGAPGSMGEVKSVRNLEAFGLNVEKDIKRERLSVSEAAAALKDRKLDAFCWDGGLPTPAVMDIAATPGVTIKILPEDKGFPALIQKYGPIYYLTTIPKGTYMGVDVDVPIIGVANILACLESLEEPLAYQITKEIFAHKPDLVAVVKSAEYLTPEAAVVGSPLPFHKGAIKYYEEKGIKVR
jgi:uncharacterized protein